MPNYFLVSLANRVNLDLCVKHALAGFTNSKNGFWTYLEIDEGDYISFLYGAKAWNLYRVQGKVALTDAQELPPWPPVTFRQSGKSYFFPFRLRLELIRVFQESLVRHEFSYVAQNLLLRGGYSKTHFQADQTTLQSVSEMGEICSKEVCQLKVNAKTFTPLIMLAKSALGPPEGYRFSEFILQALIKKHLKHQKNLDSLLADIGLSWLSERRLEILGELGLPEGHVDILIKEATPIGICNKIVVEVKLREATSKDVDQLAQYTQIIGDECKGGILIAENASRKTITYAREKGLYVFFYGFDKNTSSIAATFEQLLPSFSLKSA